MSVRALGVALALAMSVTSSALVAPRALAGSSGTASVQRALDRLTRDDGAPGALADVRTKHGTTVLTSGVADLETGAAMPADSDFRIGSMTKTYVATVVMQLVGQGRVALDAHVERYLPGVVRGHGNDGRKITIRSLLQHTTTLPEILEYYTPQDILADRYAHHDLADLLAIPLAHPPVKPDTPGQFRYCNTNYLVLSMLIEKVTHHPYGTEIKRRILTPLGLGSTSVPGDEVTIPRPHPRGYVRTAAGADPIDVTEFNPTAAAGAGDMISSGSDMSTFLDALLSGRLLHRAELAEMMGVTQTGHSDGGAYGLGLEQWSLPCGGVFWGHQGDILGFQTMSGATTDGRQATVMVNVDPGGPDAQDDDVQDAVTAALCS
ncbi:serine hydrolase [Streptomyces sp. TS71-3]|uniref:serine hydrolase domain-containing protein n=1 Tax=Streptomyces sp. TS71-3 TaxID=2733862 RepID=UPI001BB3697B|nr:serine hydrolase domain-containing protein [Streptomyces sp. TS71-3]